MRITGATTEFSGHATYEMEQLQPGDACQECQTLGRNHKLRFFYINLEEQLLKCESKSCLWPHNDEVSSDEEFNMDAAEPFTASPLESSASQQPLPPPDTLSLDPQEDEEDAFILQLLKQLTPASETDSVEPTPETKMNLSSMPDLLSLQPLKVKPSSPMELPDLSFLEENSTNDKAHSKAMIAKQEIPLLPANLTPVPKLQIPQTDNVKVKQGLMAHKISTRRSWEGKQEIRLMPASVTSPARIKPKEIPSRSPPKKSLSQPQSPPAVNITISIPELSPAVPFLDAIKRHSTEPKPSGRYRGRRPRRLAPETTGRGIRTQAVMHLIDHLETNTDVKRSSPRS
ncbi:pollen-specific leucine-rich repeat extensin-like protein 1 [Drosophila eugracilis]|uniref:pollen-specific leucine-rich repeat extensin-like protein 1 n=1 Tax=Drosophila eugracilis TaxID=29029 RepID=UPI0007E7EF2B|nr:pollen-specific leucine-rich repeat extensin-like protein 1 [Drosophila eugracilis]